MDVKGRDDGDDDNGHEGMMKMGLSHDGVWIKMGEGKEGMGKNY